METVNLEQLREETFKRIQDSVWSGWICDGSDGLDYDAMEKTLSENRDEFAEDILDEHHGVTLWEPAEDMDCNRLLELIQLEIRSQVELVNTVTVSLIGTPLFPKR